jgi:hypothetical protein
MTRIEAIERYDSLKQRRRAEFVAGLDAESRGYFNFDADNF